MKFETECIHDDGTPRAMSLDLAEGTKLVLSEDFGKENQQVDIRIDCNGIHHKKTIYLTTDDPFDMHALEPIASRKTQELAIDAALSYMESLKSFVNAAVDSLEKIANMA